MKTRKTQGKPYLEIIDPGNELRTVINQCKNLNPEIRKIQIEFLLDIYVRDLQANSIKELLAVKRRVPWPDWGFPGTTMTGRKMKIELGAVRMASNVWDMGKITNALKNILYNGFQFDPINHQAYFYPELNLCLVYNGYHHLFAGNHFCNGTIMADECHLSLIYDLIDTDGTYWIMRENGHKYGRVPDFRFAILYELARMRDRPDMYEE